MKKIRKVKNPCCGCSVYVIGEYMLIIHKNDCSWAEDVGHVRLTVLDKKGQVIETERCW